jgi:hypothetical protein
MTTTCEQCGAELKIGDYPFCGGDQSKHQPYGGYAIGDDIPGGLLVHNGLCNEDGSPRRYDTKSAMAKEAQKRGLTNLVRHVGDKGSDKSKHTQRFI